MQSVFPNRSVAGHRLAQKLAWLKQVESSSRNERIAIIAIPRGGLVVGDRIASELDAELDIVVSRKIGAPDNPEFAIGAVMPDGTYFLNQEHVHMLNIPVEYIQTKANIEVKEIDRRLKCYRGSKEYSNKFEDRTVVLVDDGIATGSTILASAKWLKNKQNCKKLVIAAPVAPPDILDDLKQVANDVIVLDTPDPFIAIGRFYEDFAQVTDEEVIGIMRKYGYSVS